MSSALGGVDTNRIALNKNARTQFDQNQQEIQQQRADEEQQRQQQALRQQQEQDALLRRQNSAAASDRLAQSNRQKIAQDDFEKSFNESLARGTLIKDLNAKGISVDAISFKTNPVTGKAENIQGYKWLDTGTKTQNNNNNDFGPSTPSQGEQAVFGSYSISQAKSAIQNPTKMDVEGTRQGYSRLQAAQQEAGDYYTQPVFGSMTRAEAATALYGPNVKARQDVQDFNVRGAYAASKQERITVSNSPEKLGPESPFGIYSPKEDLSLRAIPKDADILPLAAGTPIGQSKLKASDPNNPLTYLTSPYEGLARFGFQASKGFSPYEEFKAEYEGGEFPFKSTDTPSTALVSASSKTIGDLIGGQGFSTKNLGEAFKDISVNPAKAIGSTLGEAPLFLLPIGEGASAAKSGISTAARAIPKSLSDLGISFEAGVRTTAGLTKTGTSALEGLDAFGLSTSEKLTAFGSKAKSSISQPFNVAKTEFSYTFQPLKDTVATKASAAGEKLADFGGTVKEGVVNPLKVAGTEINYGFAPAKEAVTAQTKAIASQFSDFGGTVKEGVVNPIRATKTEISYGLQPTKDFISTQADILGTKLTDTGATIKQNIKMPVDVFTTELRYGASGIRDFLTPKDVGLPKAFADAGKAYRSAKTSEAMFRYNLDTPMGLPQETATASDIVKSTVSKGTSSGFGPKLPSSILKFKTSYDINKQLITEARAAGKTSSTQPSVFKRGFDFTAEGAPKTTKQPSTSLSPLENIDQQLSDMIIKPAETSSKGSSAIKAGTTIAGILGTNASLGLGGGVNVFAENTTSLGLGGVTGAGRTRKSKTSISESMEFTRIPDIDSITRDFIQGFNEKRAGKTSTRTNTSQDLGFGNFQDFMIDTTSRQGFSSVQKVNNTPRTTDMSKLDIFSGIRTDSILKESNIQTPGIRETTQTREITDLVKDFDITQKPRTKTPEPPRLPEFAFGAEKPSRRKKKGKKGKIYGRTFGVRDPLSAVFGGKAGKDIQRIVDRFG